jgi:sporulation protein YlmC with PRC-barrel domain
MSDELQTFSGHAVIDRHGTEVGTITDVVYDEITEEPTWGVVSPGVLHSRHYIPLAPPVYVSDAGAVVVPYDREDVLSAPKVHRNHVVTPAVRRELEHHYALAD